MFVVYFQEITYTPVLPFEELDTPVLPFEEVELESHQELEPHQGCLEPHQGCLELEPEPHNGSLEQQGVE